ncbi:MAG: ABC transporter substrate-binding protein [Pseudomonadota bacterium]|nr:ABC transporter substrate-binding protein [Pseudomonadota bacterium]
MNHRITRIFCVRLLAATLVILSAGSARAIPAEESPTRLVMETSELVLKVIQEETSAPEPDLARLYSLVYDAILPVLDFDGFAKLSLGRHWRRATPSQRTQFTEEFKGMLVRTYTKYLLDYAGTRVRLAPRQPAPPGPKRQIVKVIISLPGEAPLEVNYHFRRVKEEWKAYNVVIGGFNLVQLFRREFGEEIDQKGLDAVIERLATTNVENAPGAQAGGS